MMTAIVRNADQRDFFVEIIDTVDGQPRLVVPVCLVLSYNTYAASLMLRRSHATCTKGK